MSIVFIATTSFSQFSDKPLKHISDGGFEIKINDKGRKLYDHEIIDHLYDCDGVIAGTENYSEKIFNKLNKLKVLSRLGVGMDNINIDIAKRNNIKVFNTQTHPSVAVAELTLGLIIDISRKISIQNDQMRRGLWKKKMGNLISGKTLGVVGLGETGKTLVKLVKGFNLDILAFDINYDSGFSKEHNVTYCGLDTLMKKSDIISIHLNLSSDTKGLINTEKLNYLKSESILINTSRGAIVDEKELYELLREKKIAAAGFDVFEEEPYHGPLLELDNIVLTPHIGAYAKEIRIQMEIEAVENLIRGLNEV